MKLMVFNIYHTDNCVQCKMTMKQCDALGIPYQEINISQHPEIAEQLKAEGYAKAPIVKVLDDAQQVQDEWFGFRPDRIRAFA